jgi:PQQ-like domain
VKQHSAMHRVVRLIGLCLIPAITGGGSAWAQGRGGGGNWPTAGSDPQRTSWVRADAKISKDSLEKPGFQLLWKSKLDNQTRQLRSLTQPLLLQNIISYKGFKALAFVGGSADNVYSIDYDLNRLFWTTHLSSGVTAPGTAACPAALTTITRAAAVAAPAAGGRGGRGAGGPAAGSNTVYAISSGGMVHVLNVQTGEDLNPPIKFLPAGATAVGSMVVGTTLYAATTDNCGGAPNGVYALDMSGDAKTVSAWDAKGATIAGTVAPTFGSDGTLYAATGGGTSDSANAVVALEATGLTAKDWFSAGTSPFTSAPVVFQLQGKDAIAAANRDGRIYLLDSASLGGADHKTPLARSAQYATGFGDFMPGALATWQDAAGTRWIAVPTGSTPAADAKFTAANGTVTSGALVTFKVTGTAAAPTLEPGWVSRDLSSPVTPLVMNGVIFVVAGGGAGGPQLTAAARAQRSKPAVLYALDAATGRELWNSGTSITSPVFGVGPSGGDGQVYVVTHDGTLYAFGMPMER